jgi:hypothetical protein
VTSTGLVHGVPIVVTAGANEDIEVEVTDRKGNNIAGAVVSFGFTKRDIGEPTVWLPAAQVTTVSPSTLIASVAVAAAVVPTAGWWTIWLRIVVNGKTIIRQYERGLRAV